MKKWLILLLCCGLLVTVSGTLSAVEPQSPEGYELYFLPQDLEEVHGGGALQTERVQIPGMEAQKTSQQARQLLAALLAGPKNPSLKNTVPAGTDLLSLEVMGSHAMVDLSSAYGTLSGVDLTLADYAITMTLTQLPGIMTVWVTVNGQDLAYRSQQILYNRDVLLAPEGDVVGTVQVLLYFPNGTGILEEEQRTLSLYEGDTQVTAVIQALGGGPERKDLSAIFPDGFQVKSARLEDDTCYVNILSSMLESFPEEWQASQALDALEQSLCSLETVNDVRFLVDGEFMETDAPAFVLKPYAP